VATDKHKIWSSIHKKLKHIRRQHIISVVSILIDELVKELKIGGNIKITNFGVLKLKNYKPRIIPNVVLGKLNITKASKSLRLKLSRKLSKYLTDINLEKLK
jgi:nucleoid DNA-binding protein